MHLALGPAPDKSDHPYTHQELSAEQGTNIDIEKRKVIKKFS